MVSSAFFCVNFRVVFWAERLLRGLLVLGCRIFSRILSPDVFLSFVWEKVPR